HTLSVKILCGLDSLYRTDEANRKRAYVEASDRADTALAGQDIFPCGLDRTADRRDDAETSHGVASLRQALTSLIAVEAELARNVEPPSVAARRARVRIKPDCGAR